MAKITFKDDVQAYFVSVNSKIEKHETSKHYLIGEKGIHIYCKLKLAEMLDEVKQIGVSEFASKYDYETMKKEKETKKVVKASQKKIEKDTKKALTKEVSELEEKAVELTLQIMNLDLIRGSEKHLDIRAQLHDVYNKLKFLKQDEPREI